MKSLNDLKKYSSMMNEKDYKPSKNEDEMVDDPVKCAMDILIEAERIKQDAALMGQVQKEIRKQKKAIESIQDIKDRYVEVTIKSDPEDILDPDSGDVRFKSKKVDGESDD